MTIPRRGEASPSGAAGTPDGPVGPAPDSAPSAVSRDGDGEVGVAELVTAALSQVTHHSVVVLDRDLRYRALAGAAHGHPGYTTERLLDRPAREVLPPDVWEVHGPLLDAALRGETRTITVPSNVASAMVEVTVSPVRADGDVLGVVAVTRDVTSTAGGPGEADGDLALAFGLSFDHSPVCQALLSPDGRWVRVNRAFCDLLGLREADVVGHGFPHITDPRDHGIADEWLGRLRDGRMEHYALPSRLLHADGHVIRVHVRLAAAREPGGELRGFVAQLIDLH